MASATGKYWLVIVDRNRQDVLGRLRQKFAGSPYIEVIPDRRENDRRHGAKPTVPERRRVERRGTTYRVIERGEGYQILQANIRVPATCPECAEGIEFELPRFAELPFRIDFQVVHEVHNGRGDQHFVEAEAFRPSGRSFLACRLMARRRQTLKRAEFSPA